MGPVDSGWTMINTEKTIHFISGLPRSGSTLLCNLLAQNPRFHATATSGIIEILYAARNQFSVTAPFQAMDEETLEVKKLNVFQGILHGYFNDVEQPVCFEKSRTAEAHMEMYQHILGRRPKVISCVRDIREVLASFERLYFKTKPSRQLPDERMQLPNGASNYWTFDTCVGRCNWLMKAEGGIVGTPIVRMRECVLRGWQVTNTGDPKADIYFLDYDDLTTKPEKSLDRVYKFLGEENFRHDFDHVEQVTQEDDLIHVYKDLHKIRPKVEPQESTWPFILPVEYARSLEGECKFWEKLKNWPTVR
jgi:sulfotransferase